MQVNPGWIFWKRTLNRALNSRFWSLKTNQLIRISIIGILLFICILTQPVTWTIEENGHGNVKTVRKIGFQLNNFEMIKILLTEGIFLPIVNKINVILNSVRYLYHELIFHTALDAHVRIARAYIFDLSMCTKTMTSSFDSFPNSSFVPWLRFLLHLILESLVRSQSKGLENLGKS